MSQGLQPHDPVPEGWTRIKSVYPYRRGPQWQALKFDPGENNNGEGWTYAGFLYVFTGLDGSQTFEARAVHQSMDFDTFEETVAWVECRVVAARRGATTT